MALFVGDLLAISYRISTVLSNKVHYWRRDCEAIPPSGSLEYVYVDIIQALRGIF